MATRYAVATGNWNDNNTWAATDGGTAGASFPTSADDVFLTATSGVITVTINVSSAAKSIDSTGYLGTLKMDALLTIAGAGVTVKFAGTISGSSKAITFSATAAGTNLFTSGGNTFGAITLGTNIVSSTIVKLQDNLSSGTINAGGVSLDSNSKTITINGTNGIVSLGGTAAAVWTLTGTTVTITCGGQVNWPPGTSFVTNTATLIAITSNNNGVLALFTSNGDFTVNDIASNGTGYTIQAFNATSPSCRNLTFTGPASKNKWCLFSAGKTFTCTGTLTLTGNSAVNRLSIGPNDDAISSGVPKWGTAVTFNAAVVALTNLNMADCVGAGAAAPFTGTSMGDAQGNSSITFDTPTTLYWFSNTGDWDDVTKWFLGSGGTGGAGRVPLPQDTARFDPSSFTTGSRVVSTNGVVALCGAMNWTGATNTPTLNFTGGACAIFGDVTLIAAMALTQVGGNSTTFASRGALVVNDAGLTWPQDTTYCGPGGTWTLTGPFTVASATTFIGCAFSAGSFVTNNFNVTIPRFVTGQAGLTTVLWGSTNGQLTRSIALGSSLVIVNGNGGTNFNIWNVAGTTGLTFNAGTSTIKLTGSSASARTWTLGGLTYYDIWWAGNLGAGAHTISGSNTFHDFKIDTSGTYNFTAGTTQTVTTFSVNGSDSTHKVTLQSTSGGTAWNLSCASGVIADFYLSIQDSHASGGATFLAYESTSVSGNTGWRFVQVVIAAGIGEGVGTGPNLDAMSAAGVGRGFGAGSLSASITFVAAGVARGIGSADLDTAVFMVAAGVGLGVGHARLFIAEFPTVVATVEVLDDSASPPEWIDISDDVDLFSSPILVEYGITGSDPVDRVANAGRGMFNLDDSEYNSSETLGLYSLFHADRLAAFDLDKEIRISFSSEELGGYTKYKFRGRLVDAPPDAGIYGDRLTRCSALDWFDDAAEAEEPDIPLQVGQRVDQIAQALFDGLNRPPTTTIIEQGSDILELAVDGGTGQKLTVRNRLQQLLCTEFGYAYPIGDETEGGTVRVENRYHRLSNPDVMFEVTKIDTIEMRATRDDFYRRVRVTVHPVNDYANAAEQIVFSLQEASVVIQAGETNTSIFGPYVDPDSHQRIGASDTQDPDPGSPADYVMTSVDGMDEDLTSFFTVVASRTGLGVAWTITNAGLKPAAITRLTLRGKPIFRYDLFITREVTGVGDKTLPFDMAFQNSAAVGELIASFLADTRSTRAAHVHSVRFLATTDTNHLRAAIQLEPGDRIALTEEVTGLDADEFTINGVQLEYREGGDLWCTWILEVASTHQYFPLSTLGAIEVGQLTSGTFSTSEELIMPHEFGGTNQASRNETTYPVGATLDKLVLASDVVTFNSTDLPAGTYNLVVTLATDGGGTVTVALVNLTDDPATALVEVASTSATGQQVISGAISFAAGGSPKTYGLKMKVTTGNGYAWCARLVRTA